MHNETPQDPVERHYGRAGIVQSVMQTLRAMGKDPAHLTPRELAAIDQFHTRGRHATVELAERAALKPGERVLDVGCGLGGSARYLAAERQCRVTGIDLTPEYVDAAAALAELVGLQAAVTFRQASALAMPFPDGSFDVVWTEHVQMNISDKQAFYAEIARVLVPGGRLVFHDIFQGDGGEVHYPVPWAENREISFLAPPETVQALLADLGFQILDWEDKSSQSLAWFQGARDRLQAAGSPPGGGVFMGPTARNKFDNMLRNLAERRCNVVQAVARKG